MCFAVLGEFLLVGVSIIEGRPLRVFRKIIGKYQEIIRLRPITHVPVWGDVQKKLNYRAQCLLR